MARLQEDLETAQKRIAQLEYKLVESCQRQHEVENVLEEYEVNSKSQADEARQLTHRCSELQKRYTIADKERKNCLQRIGLLEKDKKVATERWVRASYQIKQKDKEKTTRSTIFN